MIIEAIKKNILPLFFPTNCVSCDGLVSSEQFFCNKCKRLLPYIGMIHDHNHPSELRLQHRFPYRRAYSCFLMSRHNAISKALYLLKYKNNQEIGLELGKLMAKDMQQHFRTDDIDCILPIPLNVKKEKTRGYNQSEILAQEVADLLMLPMIDKAVIRTKNTQTQTKKTRIERLKNLDGTFQIAKPEALQGKHILLLDDVLTTGATLEAVALTVISIPDTTVSVATLSLASDY